MAAARVAIIGLGRMASTIDDEVRGYPAVTLPYSVAAACAASDRLELVAGCDLLADKRDAFRERHGVGAVYDEFAAMIREQSPDLVAICTRADNHAELAVATAELGVPAIYCEKAMACSMAEADRVRTAVEQRGVVFNTGVLRRYDNRYERLRALVAEGAIGKPAAAVHYAGATLMHGHVHSIDTLLYLLGDPAVARVQGELRPADTDLSSGRLDQDPRAVYRLVTDSGIDAATVPAGAWDFELIGSEGTLRITNNGTDVEIRRRRPLGERWSRFDLEPLPAVDPPRSATQTCLEDLADALAAGSATREGVAHAHHVTEACLAVAESHRRGGEWVELPLEDRELYVWHV